MKLSNKKTVVWIFAAFASLGIAHAEENGVEIPTPNLGQMEIIQDLLREGVIAPMPQENWYQINHKRLRHLMDQELEGNQTAHQTIELLQRICGEEVDIQEMNILAIKLGTQDVTARR